MMKGFCLANIQHLYTPRGQILEIVNKSINKVYAMSFKKAITRLNVF